MKKAFRPLLALFCACLLFACSNSDNIVDEQLQDQKRPTVKYEVVPGDDPFTFSFENGSENYKSLEWRFGDDSVSYEKSPSHVYLSDGKFEVTLKATAEDGSTARKVYVITIDPEEVGKIVALKTGAPDEVRFTATSTAQIVSANWDFGDKSPVSTELSPTHKYEAGKLFFANATITTNKGSVVRVKKLVSSNGTLVEVINKYLVNTGPVFKAAQRVGDRWGIVADWRVNQAVKQRTGGMGSWDQWQGNTMSMEKWGGEPDIVNGKIEQTSLIPLPAGQYYYELKYWDFQIKDKMYLVAAKGDVLPDVDKVENNPDVLGYLKISGNQSDGKGPLLYNAFRVPTPQIVTFGFVATFTQSDQTMKLQEMRLYRQDE